MGLVEYYPTRNGISIPTQELWLPSTKLDTSDERNLNLHHSEWTARQFGRSILFMTVRNLARLHETLPKDVHEFIHKNYEPPVMPTPRQAIEAVDEAFYNEEQIRVRQFGKYALLGINKDLHRACLLDYNNLK